MRKPRTAVQFLDDGEKLSNVAGQPVHLGDHEGVAFLQPLHEPFELLPLAYCRSVLR